MIVALASAAGLLLGADAAQAQQQGQAQAHLGTWLTDDQKAKIELRECGTNGLCSEIVWLADPVDENGRPWRDENHPDPSKRSRPVVGIDILKGTKKVDDRAWSGEIYDPEEGKHYYLKRIAVGSDKVEIRGCLPTGWPCRTKYWTRTAPVRQPEPVKIASRGAPEARVEKAAPAPVPAPQAVQRQAAAPAPQPPAQASMAPQFAPAPAPRAEAAPAPRPEPQPEPQRQARAVPVPETRPAPPAADGQPLQPEQQRQAALAQPQYRVTAPPPPQYGTTEAPPPQYGTTAPPPEYGVTAPPPESRQQFQAESRQQFQGQRRGLFGWRQRRMANMPPDATTGSLPRTQSGVPTQPGSTYLVQVTAGQDQNEALRTFGKLQSRYPQLLGGYLPNIQRVDLGERGVWYRVRVGPMAQRTAAASFCQQLKAAGADCLIRRE